MSHIFIVFTIVLRKIYALDNFLIHFTYILNTYSTFKGLPFNTHFTSLTFKRNKIIQRCMKIGILLFLNHDAIIYPLPVLT